MKLKRILWYKKVFPIFLIETTPFFERNIYLCVHNIGPIVLTKTGSHCGEKRRMGVCYAEQFYRMFGLRWLIGKLSSKTRLWLEVDAQAHFLLPFSGSVLTKHTLNCARYVWSEKGFREVTTVDEIKGRILHKRLLLTNS